MLSLVSSLFADFEREDIRYCHWKSNFHLDAALEGKTDLDILVTREQSIEIRKILHKNSFRLFSGVGFLRYSSIEDFVGMDNETTSLVHVHLHYELVVGKKFLKGTHLPFEKEILRTRKKSLEGIYVIDPNVEVIVLLIRSVIKGEGLSETLFHELQWLMERIDMCEIISFSELFFGKEFGLSTEQLIKSFPDLREYNSFKHIAKKVLEPLVGEQNRLNFRYLLRKAIMANKFIKSRVFRLPVPYKRTICEGGVIVAFIGVDGAGKSTIVEDTSTFIRKKLDVYCEYFGSGDGNASFLRRPLIFLKRFRKSDNDSEKTSRSIGFSKAVWAIILALEKKKKFRRIVTARSRGMIVLCDRYPQIQFAGFNDGPLLGEWLNSNSQLKRVLACWEKNIYKEALIVSPDLVLKLRVGFETARTRKPDTREADLRRKLDTIEKLEYSGSPIRAIDAEQSLELVMNDVRREIWKII